MCTPHLAVRGSDDADARVGAHFSRGVGARMSGSEGHREFQIFKSVKRPCRQAAPGPRRQKKRMSESVNRSRAQASERARYTLQLTPAALDDKMCRVCLALHCGHHRAATATAGEQGDRAPRLENSNSRADVRKSRHYGAVKQLWSQGKQTRPHYSPCTPARATPLAGRTTHTQQREECS